VAAAIAAADDEDIAADTTIIPVITITIITITIIAIITIIAMLLLVLLLVLLLGCACEQFFRDRSIGCQ
jgi:hypothetical protein